MVYEDRNHDTNNWVKVENHIKSIFKKLLTCECINAEIQNLMHLRDSISDVLRWEDASTHVFHRVQILFSLVNALLRIAQSDDKVIGSGSSAVGLENVLQALLNADVLLRSDAEISDGNRGGKINARKQPANGHGKKSQDGKKDEQASRAARDTDHQNGAEKEEEREET